MAVTSADPDPAASAACDEIAREMARVHLDTYGGPEAKVRVAMAAEMVAVMTDIDLAAGELTLIEAGRAESVRESRVAYQEVAQEVFVAIVERATGRRVVGFSGHSVIAVPVPWASEVFRLAVPGVSRLDPR